MNTLTLEGAIRWACYAHIGAKYGNDPYILHPLRLLGRASPKARIVAVLHDVKEDFGELPEGLSLIDDMALELVTRNKMQSYDSYIDGIMNAKGEAGDIAREVKYLDVTDHLNHSPKTPAHRERYEKARDRIEAHWYDEANKANKVYIL